MMFKGGTKLLWTIPLVEDLVERAFIVKRKSVLAVMERNQIIEKSLVPFADYHYVRNNATKANFTKE